MKACQRQRRYTLIGLLFGVAAVVYPASLASQILARTDVVPTAIPLLGVDSPPAASAELDSLLQILERFDSDRVDELAARYDQRGNVEKRRLEKRFGVIEHRFRVNADPRGIFQCWVAAGHGEAVLVDALKEKGIEPGDAYQQRIEEAITESPEETYQWRALHPSDFHS